MILFLTYFILLSDKLFRRKFVELAGPTLSKKKLTRRDHRQHLVANRPVSHGPDFHEPGRRLRHVGGACGYMGLEQAALWGLLAGVFNSIPYYGPLIVSGGLSIVAFLQFGTLYMMVARSPACPS